MDWDVVGQFVYDYLGFIICMILGFSIVIYRISTWNNEEEKTF